MELTVLGAIITLGLLLAVARRPQWLPLWFAFSAPFSGVAVANLSWTGGEARHVQPWVAIAVAMLARASLEHVARRQTRFEVGAMARALLVWAGAVVAALIGAGTAVGRSVYDVDPACSCAAVIEREGGWTARMGTQAAYVLLGVMSTMVIPRYLGASRLGAENFLRSFVWGATGASGVALCYLAGRMLGFDWDLRWLNNSANPFAQGWLQKAVVAELPRLSAGAAEPSLFAQALLASLAICVGGRGRVPVKGRAGVASVLLLTAGLVASTSTTAYVGLGVLVCLWLADRVAGRGIALRELAALSVMLGVIGSFFVSGTGRAILTAYVTEKFESSSFVDRLASVGLGLEAFSERPMLGWGPGVLTARSLPVWLLANTGVVGLLAFALVVLVAWKVLRKISETNRVLGRAVGFCFAIVLVSDAMTGASTPFGFFWVPVAAILALEHRSRRRPEQRRGDVQSEGGG